MKLSNKNYKVYHKVKESHSFYKKVISFFIYIVLIIFLQTVKPNLVFAASYDGVIEVLGGGGGGGIIVNSGGGGGGGGEYRRCIEVLSVQTYTVTVGVGGTIDVTDETDSTFSGTGITMTADGGNGTATAAAGTAGTGGVSTECGTAVANFDGGTPGAGDGTADGGGGAGGGAGYGGKGGNGTNSSTTVGGGGGGGAGETGAGGDAGVAPAAGVAGAGGGGAGGAGGDAAVGGAGSAGVPATYSVVGGGGGGGGDNGFRGGTCGAPGAGSGGGEVTGAGNGCRGEIRIIYVDAEVDATGGTQTTSGVHRIHTFTASGTFQVTALNAAAPTVTTTNPATNIAVTSATLNGIVVSLNGSNGTEYGFAWGTNSGLLSGGAATTTQLAGFAGSNIEFSKNTSGLLAGVTYYFRAYATNPIGTGYGAIVSFVAGTDTTLRRRMRLFEGYKLTVYGGKIIINQQ